MKGGLSLATGMTREEFARVRELFHRAYVLTPPEREALLESECAGRDSLRTAVEELFHAGGTAAGRLDPDDGSIARRLLLTAAEAAQPSQVGPYRVDRLLGRGGMGEVYLAEQSNPRREVALKILRGGPDARGRGARFSREVRAMGRLEHPGIARIYEAGVAETTVGPLSYLAMEYIRGPRLSEYVATHSLTIAQRLELVAKIADAVQYAHSRGVIHRDLKPSNILVAEEETSGGAPADAPTGTHARVRGPQPKILDFGVARVFEADEQRTEMTEAGLLIGTVSYMSPEQLAGDNTNVDARADVYSMGVVLYELLAGRLPHDVRSKPVPEAARIVRDEDPAPLTISDGGGRMRIDRDIQTMVGRAMAKDREHRYATAAAMADDLRRYVRNEPILARPASAAYQLSKFAKRHRGLVFGALAAGLALVGGLVTSTVLFAREQEARRRADEKERLSAAVQDYLVNGLLMAAAPDRMGHEVKMLDVLTQATEALRGRFTEDPEVEASIRVQLADVLMKVGKFDQSEAQWEMAIPLLEKTFGRDDPRAISALIKQSRTLYQLHKRDPAIRIAKEALARARVSLPAADPIIVAALEAIGLGHRASGRFNQASLFLWEGLELAERAPAGNEALIVSLKSAINDCKRPDSPSESRVEQGRQIVEEAADVMGAESPTTINAKSNLLLALVKEGRADEAVAIATDLPAAAERTFAPGHLMRGYVYRSTAGSFSLAGRFAEAERYSLQAYEVFANASPRLEAEVDDCITQLRAIYAAEPGQSEQLREWCVKGVGVRLLRSPATRWFSIPTLLRQVEADMTNAGAPLSQREFLDRVWGQRDLFVPDGHANRAFFFANYARACRFLDHPAHAEEALALATAALSDSQRPEAAAVLIEKATNQAAKQ